VRVDSGLETAGSGGGSTDARGGVVVDITGRVGEAVRWRHCEIPRGGQAASCDRLAGRSERGEGCWLGAPGAGLGPGAA